MNINNFFIFMMNFFIMGLFSVGIFLLKWGGNLNFKLGFITFGLTFYDFILFGMILGATIGWLFINLSWYYKLLEEKRR